MTDDIILRSPTNDEELRRFYDPLLTAFAEEFSAGEAEAEQPLMELDRLVNAFEGERRIGSAGAFSMRLTVPGGGTVPASGITAVGVVPDQRRRGVLRRMMDWLLDDAIRRSEPLAILWASEGAIYQRFGFGHGTVGSSFEVDRGRLVFREPFPPRDDVRIRMLDDLDEAVRLIPPVYDEATAGVAGTIARSEPLWRNLILPDQEWSRGANGMKYRAVLEVGGAPRAYVIYRVKGDWSPRGPQGILTVVELMAIDPEAEGRLWAWIAAFDLISTVRAWRAPFPNPLQLRLAEPRRLGLTVGDGLWIRFVDLPAALGARAYAGEGSLVLDVADPLIEPNAGRWRLTVRADGTADVARTDAEPDLALDVADLACTYLGAFRFVDLARAGRVRASHDGALETADRLFTPVRAPYSNTMF